MACLKISRERKWFGCGFALLFGFASLADPIFPPRSTVVLMAGLPGDVESENSYAEQLQAWLEIARASGNAQELLVLCDDPEALNHQNVTSSASGNVTLRADRTNFVSLGASLAGQTNPLVVIAWGHGGKQGNTPVFHVRGPRLTPADFKALAAQTEGRESRWILMFRGSGAFARQLAEERRQILSSESDTMFNSDPIGMGVLLKLARAKPELPFVASCEEFGHATAAWYKQRNLARTEEPTLWLGNEKPRLLTPASEENSLASAKPEETTEAPTNKPAGLSPAASELPAAWKEIKRADPKQYPDADGVVLRRRVNYTLGSSPALLTEQEEFIQILTPEGKRLGDFDFSYFPPPEDITFLDCEVLRVDGKLDRLDPDAIRESHGESAGDYQAGRRKFFSLPGVGPGVVLHVKYRTQWRDFPLPHVSMEIPLVQELPVADAAVQISLPKDASFHFAFENLPPLPARNERGEGVPDPVIKQTSYGTTYTWHFEDLPAQEREVLSPPHESARLLFSTFPDWPAFAEWYSRISKLADEATPEISAKAAELTREAKNNRERVVAIYNYVTGLRYVAIPLGVNSFRPHAATKVLQNQFGDCKDKANLFNTLLRSLKIEANLVLVPRFSQAHDAIPGLSFNHAISRVKLGDETIWVDTTDDVCRFGMLPPGDPGRKVLVIGPDTAALTQLPAPDPRDHRLKLRGEVDCSGAGPSFPTKWSATALGYPDYELREAARTTKAHGASLPLLAIQFRPVAGSFALETQATTSVSALGEEFTWHAEGISIGIANPTIQPSNTPASLSLFAPFWLPKEWDLALHRRKTPLFLNQGYPLTLEEEFEFALPAGARVPALPGVAENKDGPLRWRVEWRKAGEGNVAARFHAELVRGELSAQETLAMQKHLGELVAALGAGVGVEVRQ